MRLSDAIEQFIKTMLTQDEREIELKRNELAEYFNCAPSQINYVLATRFTPDHGYIIESRRGGGGYIRIFRMEQDTSEQLLYLLHERVGEAIPALEASHLISQLKERNLIEASEASLMRAAVTTAEQFRRASSRCPSRASISRAARSAYALSSSPS